MTTICSIKYNEHRKVYRLCHHGLVEFVTEQWAMELTMAAKNRFLRVPPERAGCPAGLNPRSPSVPAGIYFSENVSE